MVNTAAETAYYLWLAAGAFGLLCGGYLVLLVQRWRALQAALAGLQANAEQQEAGRSLTQIRKVKSAVPIPDLEFDQTLGW